MVGVPEQQPWWMIADDLTGACDAGVAFLPAVVALREECRFTPGDTRIWTTHSRDEAEEVAVARVADAARAVPAGVRLYKKIDSVMRGHVRAELAAMLAATGRPRAVVCPAFPEQGRTVVDGVAWPAGVDLRALLAGLPVETPDAVTPEDLARIAASAAPGDLLVGSAGLARALGRVPPRVEVSAQLGPGIALLVAGSVHPATAAQLARVADEQGVEVVRLDLAAPSPEMLYFLRHRVETLAAGGLLLTGGDTALLVARLLGAEGIRLEAEIEPGIPLGRLIGGAGDGVAVVTKSGGFGGADTLAGVARVLSVQNRRSV
ncbi:MAG: four-carbon acid sugar kinase family protein [Bryobacterales bacterium]|nr:four-carbon acid sugar kinase family protein [Bryobacterales bacterium]